MLLNRVVLLLKLVLHTLIASSDPLDKPMALLTSNHGHWPKLFVLEHLLSEALLLSRFLLLLQQELSVAGELGARPLLPRICIVYVVIVGTNNTAPALVLLPLVLLSRVAHHVTDMSLIVFAAHVGVQGQERGGVLLDLQRQVVEYGAIRPRRSGILRPVSALGELGDIV